MLENFDSNLVPGVELYKTNPPENGDQIDIRLVGSSPGCFVLNRFGEERLRVLRHDRVNVVEGRVQRNDEKRRSQHPEHDGSGTGQIQQRNRRHVHRDALLVRVELPREERHRGVCLLDLVARVENASEHDQDQRGRQSEIWDFREFKLK